MQIHRDTAGKSMWFFDRDGGLLWGGNIDVCDKVTKRLIHRLLVLRLHNETGAKSWLVKPVLVVLDAWLRARLVSAKMWHLKHHNRLVLSIGGK